MATTEHTEQLHEKHNGMNGNYDPEAQRMDALKQFRSAASVQMSPELFEKLYLSPMNEVKGNLRQTFGNPTPMYAHSSSQYSFKVTDKDIAPLLASFSPSLP